MARTPADRWKHAVANHRKKCQAILGVSDNIRYAGVINSYGRTLAGIVKPGLKPLLNPEHAQNEFFIIPTLLSMRKDSSHTMGGLKYVLLQHRMVSIVVLHKGAVTYYISLNKKEKDLDGVITGIEKII